MKAGNRKEWKAACERPSELCEMDLEYDVCHAMFITRVFYGKTCVAQKIYAILVYKQMSVMVGHITRSITILLVVGVDNII